MEIKKYAVVKQTDLLNKVRLMKALQEPDEPVRMFVARLRGLAHVCNLPTKCPSQLCTAYNVNTTILLAVLKGLVDVASRPRSLLRWSRWTWRQ